MRRAVDAALQRRWIKPKSISGKLAGCYGGSVTNDSWEESRDGVGNPAIDRPRVYVRVGPVDRRDSTAATPVASPEKVAGRRDEKSKEG